MEQQVVFLPYTACGVPSSILSLDSSHLLISELSSLNHRFGVNEHVYGALKWTDVALNTQIAKCLSRMI